MVDWTGIGVGAQSSLGGQDIFARKICTKNYFKNQKNAPISHASCPKNYKNIRMFMLFAR